MAKKWTKKDTKKATQATNREVRESAHKARDDMQKAGLLPEREANKSDSEKTKDSEKAKAGAEA